MRQERLLALVLAGMAGFSFLVWRAYAHRPLPVYVDIVRDRSQSFRAGCSTVTQFGSDAMGLASGHVDSTLTFVVTGTRAASYEPEIVFSKEIPVSTQVLAKKRFSVVQRQFMADLETHCKALSPTDDSPIYIAIKQALEDLRKTKGSGSAELYLFVETDLQDTHDPDIRAALAQPPGKISPLPRVLDNTAVTTVICGYAQTWTEKTFPGGKRRQLTTPRYSWSSDRVIEVWTKLFRDPELVSFKPFCPGDSGDATNLGERRNVE